MPRRIVGEVATPQTGRPRPRGDGSEYSGRFLGTGPGIVCRATRGTKPIVRQEPRSEDAVAERPKRAIVCAHCKYRITSEDQRIRVNGSHDHRCVNPHGIVFRIGCFRRAPGCYTSAVPTTEFTWFHDFAWNFSLCRGCGALLGWCYHGFAEIFFGLILDRLATEDRLSE